VLETLKTWLASIASTNVIGVPLGFDAAMPIVAVTLALEGSTVRRGAGVLDVERHRGDAGTAGGVTDGDR
jgi:hypothetical protein